MESAMSAAIYYTPEAYSTNGPKLMGRNSAGESFLRGYLKHSRADSFWVQSDQAEHARQYVETVKAAGRPTWQTWRGPARCISPRPTSAI